MPSRLIAVLLAGCLFALGSCGDDDGDEGLSDEEQAYADAWAATLADGDQDDVRFSDEEAACMGDAVMAELGVEPFEEAGVEADEINADGEDDDSPGEVLGDGVVTDAQADAVLDVWDGCADLPAALTASIATEVDLDDEAQECVADGIEERGLAREGYTASFTTDEDEPPEEVLQELFALVDDCGSSAGTDALAESIAETLAADGSLTDEQAACIAREVVADVGRDRLLEVGGTGSFEEAPPEVQAEIGQAVSRAAGACDVPLSAFEG
jgi:hypothetical protein